jgi:hypothetical protein
MQCRVQTGHIGGRAGRAVMRSSVIPSAVISPVSPTVDADEHEHVHVYVYGLDVYVDEHVSRVT